MSRDITPYRGGARASLSHSTASRFLFLAIEILAFSLYIIFKTSLYKDTIFNICSPVLKMRAFGEMRGRSLLDRLPSSPPIHAAIFHYLYAIFQRRHAAFPRFKSRCARDDGLPLSLIDAGMINSSRDTPTVVSMIPRRDEELFRAPRYFIISLYISKGYILVAQCRRHAATEFPPLDEPPLCEDTDS